MTTENFNRIVQQLIDPPAPSSRVLEQAEHGQASPSRESANTPLLEARSWVQEVMKKEYWPPEDTPFIAIPMEAGLCDVIRAKYHIGTTFIEIAQSKFILSIRVIDLPTSRDQSAVSALVEQTAARVLSLTGITRVDVSAVGALRYSGGLLVSMQDADPDWPDWRHSLRWWAGGGNVGFVATKLPGGPTREVIDDEEQSNIHWFD